MYSHNTCHVNRTGLLYGSCTEGNYIRYCLNKCIQTSECTASIRLITCILFCLCGFFNFCFIFSRRCSFYSFQMLLFIKRKNTKIFSKGIKTVKGFSWSAFSCIWAEYGYLIRKYPYSVQIQENKNQKKLRICTLFTS